MPRVFDNIDQKLLPNLRDNIADSERCDICVGYFHLRGWGSVADQIEHYEGTDDSCCRVLVGMQKPPKETMKDAQRARSQDGQIDGPTLARLKSEMAQSFKEQIEFGIPTDSAEETLRTLARQLREEKVRVKIYLRHRLHAKLYLVERDDINTPKVGFVGSSNLSISGLVHQGELNVDVVGQDAARKLQKWFNERWEDERAYDISDTLAELIEESWAREELVDPHLVYLKMAHHLCSEIRQGEREFRLPDGIGEDLLEHNEKAVLQAASHLQRKGGVLLGDVVGLGKTYVAMATAKIFQEDDGSDTLVICPPRLKEMWLSFKNRYGIAARVLSLGKVIDEMPSRVSRFETLIIDESHNFRNRESKRYQRVQEYIEDWEPRVMLLTATPYNKQYEDLSNQLRLFLDEQEDLRVRPERFFREWQEDGKNEADFVARFQAPSQSLRAFEESDHPEDWQDLMRLFLVRRTRSYIIENYAEYDEERDRHYVRLGDERSYFPKREPETLEFEHDPSNPKDQYGQLYREAVVEVIEDLDLPRYGMAQYLIDDAEEEASAQEENVMEDLNRAGRRLIGFCRTNLFKRSESSGYSFLLSVKRHILRNMVTRHAVNEGKPVPIGVQDASMLDTTMTDKDRDQLDLETDPEGEEVDPGEDLSEDDASDEAYTFPSTLEAYHIQAERIYNNYWNELRNRFNWLSPDLFEEELNEDLLDDSRSLIQTMREIGTWRAQRDAKLNRLHELLTEKHADDKVLIFTQFSDTARYVGEQLQNRGIEGLEIATSNSSDPTSMARRFSPETNDGLRKGESEIRVLVSTDMLSEGQNLQQGHIVVNFDLPWAIIGLIQRAGRVDRIGQEHDTILVYSFLPNDGVDQIIRLRSRLTQRLQQNREVIGTDEKFFDEDQAEELRHLYAEKPEILSDDEEEDVDLASVALQIWNSASEKEQKAAQNLPPVTHATRPLKVPSGNDRETPGVITYLSYPDGSESLVRVNEEGEIISQSLSATFRAAACGPGTPALERADGHYELVRQAVGQSVEQKKELGGGQLGTRRSTRRKVYDRLKTFRKQLRQNGDLFSSNLAEELDPALNGMYRATLKRKARTKLKRQLRTGIQDKRLAELVVSLHEDERLCQPAEEEPDVPEPQIVCSLGLREDTAS